MKDFKLQFLDPRRLYTYLRSVCTQAHTPNTYGDVVDFVIKLLQIIRMLAQVVHHVRCEKEVN